MKTLDELMDISVAITSSLQAGEPVRYRDYPDVMASEWGVIATTLTPREQAQIGIAQIILKTRCVAREHARYEQLHAA